MMMRRMFDACSAIGVVIVSLLNVASAQSGPTLLGSAYTVPTLSVAPGQVITLQVSGLKAVLTAPTRADRIPLPTMLSGISLTLRQHFKGGIMSLPVPILSIEQRNRCSDPLAASQDCMLTLMTVQIPFEMNVVPFSSDPPTELLISENGIASRAFSATQVIDDLHIRTDCGMGSGPCVTHADGSLVTANAPAKPGEVVVIYALGLGQTEPLVPSGEATPRTPPVLNSHVFVGFDFRPNAGPSRPYVNPLQPGNSQTPVFAGLTPGAVGLYQINVKLPDVFPTIPPCSTGEGFYQVFSNMTINVSTNYLSFDGAAICLQPPQ
jgi:hypothetical protein